MPGFFQRCWFPIDGAQHFQPTRLAGRHLRSNNSASECPTSPKRYCGRQCQNACTPGLTHLRFVLVLPAWHLTVECAKKARLGDSCNFHDYQPERRNPDPPPDERELLDREERLELPNEEDRRELLPNELPPENPVKEEFCRRLLAFAAIRAISCFFSRTWLRAISTARLA